MLNFDWLNNLRIGKSRKYSRRPARRRSAKKSRARHANVEVLQIRTMLSGDPIASMSMSDGHDHSEHEQHAHPAAMALISTDQATNTVVASGDWSDPAVWQNGTLPADGARIIIPQGMTLTVDSVIPQEFKTIGIHGTLSFKTDVDTELRVDTIISAPSGRFEMGTAANPIAASVTARVVFVDDGAIDTNWDPEQLSRGAVLQGPTEIHGAETTHQVTLAAHPAAGATTLQLSSVPVGWNAGDEIVITGTQGATSDEVRTIAAIDGTTVTLNQALALDHTAPRADLNVYVANTTRNVVMASENPATAHRGHTMFMHTSNVSVKNAAFTDLGRTDKKIPLDDFNFEFPEDAVGNTTSAGVVFTATPGARTNVRGRYPVHFHRGGTDPGSTRGVVDGSVVLGSPGYGLVNHSSNVDLTNNVSYDIHGSAFYTEAGDEIGSIADNIAIRTVNPDFRLEDNGEISVDLRADQQDFGVDGDAFWLSGHLVSMTGNVASGASGHGIIIWSDGLVEADRGRTTVKTSDIENGHLITGRDTIPTWWAPLAEISNNEASNATIGFRARYIHSSIYLGDVGSPFHEPPSQEYIDTLRPEINGLTVWGSRDGALLNYNERLSLKNAQIVGIGAPYVRQGGTTDLGVGIDMYNDVSRGPGVVENVSVEGFNMGILAPRHNGWQMNNIHLRNTTDLHIEQATGTHRVLEMSNITFGDLAGTAVAGNEGQRQNVVMQGSDSDVEQPFWFLMADTVTLDGQGLYFNEQAASHVPLTEDNHGEARVPAPAEFVGLTNQQLQDRYGTSFAGEITPDDAQAVSWLSGGVVASLPSPGQTTPPLYDLRDGGEGNIPDLGNLTNFDPSQLPTSGPDDEDGDEEDSDGHDTDEEDDETGGEDEGDDESDEEPGDDEEDSDEDGSDDGDEDTDEEPGDEEDGEDTDDESGDEEDPGDEDSDQDDEEPDGGDEDEGDEDSEDDEPGENDEGGEDQDLESLISQVRDLSDEEVNTLIENVEDEDARQEVADILNEIRELSEEELSEALSEMDDEERQEIAEFLSNILGGDDESDEGDEEPGDDDESDEGDDEPGDDDESDEGDDEPDEGDEEPSDDDESDEGDEEPGDDGETGDIFPVSGTLVGTEESEKLQGFESDDVITGNGGSDLFPFTAGNDVITDFNPSEDMIDVGDFARPTDDFAVLTSLEAIAANATEVEIDGVPSLVIDVDGENGTSTTTLIGVTLEDLNASHVFFGLDGESIPPLEFTHIPETTVTLNDGTVATFAAHDLSVHPLPFELVSGNQESVDILNGVDSDDEGGESDDDEIDDDGMEPDGEDDPVDEDEGQDSDDEESGDEEDTDEGDEEADDGDEEPGDDGESDEEPGDDDESDEGDDESDEGDADTDSDEGQDIESLLGQLRALSDEEVNALIEGLDVEDEAERQETADFLNELRSLSDEELGEVLGEISEEERAEITEFLGDLLGGGADEDDEDSGDNDESGDEESGDGDEDSDEDDGSEDEDDGDSGDGDGDDGDSDGDDEGGDSGDGDHDHGDGDHDHDDDGQGDTGGDDDHGDDGQGDTGGDGDGGHDHGDHSCDAHADNPTLMQEHCAAMALATPEAATHSVVASGDWSDPNVWQNGTVPTNGAAAYIPAGMTVTVDGMVSETIQTLRIDGTLRFQTDINTELRVDTVIAAPGSRFEMGTAANPIADGVTARLLVADTGEVDRANDPFFLGRGLILHGSTVIHGAAKTSFATTAIAPREGDTTITLSEVPTNWDVGDTLVIAGTRIDAEGDEVVTIASIDGATITLEDALEFDHVPPRSEFAVHVANTTRNAVIESENSALDRRGHLMFMHSRDVQISYGGFYELGRTNKLEELNNAELDENGQLIEETGTNPAGRYSVHFHRNGVRADSPPSTVHGSAVVGSPGWGYVNHSSYVDFTDNVSYNVNGAAFNTEAGDEIGSFIGNLSIRTHGTGGSPVERQGLQDFGHAGDGFWFQGAGIRIENNVATGATGAGLIVYSDALIQEGLGRTEFLTENLADPSLAGDLQTMPVTLVPLRSFKGNTAYGSIVGARTYYHRTLVQVDEDQFDQAAQLRGVFPDSVMEDMLIWNSNHGYLANYTVDTIFRDFTIVNAADQIGESGYNATNVYNRGRHTYENFEVEGFATGLIPSRNGVVEIVGGRFSNGQDIQIQEPRQSHRLLTTSGTIDFVDGPGVQFEDEFIPRQNIVMSADPRSIPDSAQEWYLLNSRVILNHNGHDGEQLFYAEQAADHVLYTEQPAQAVPDDPAPGVTEEHIGLTNAQLQEMFGRSFGGEVPSTDAVDAPDDGIVGLLGSATPDPGPFPEHDDPLAIDPVELAEIAEGIRELQQIPQADIDQLLAALGPNDADVEFIRATVETLRSLDDSEIESYIESLSIAELTTTVSAIDTLFESTEEPDDEEPGDDEDPGEDDEEPGDDEDPGEDDEEPGDDEDPGEDDEEPGDDEDPGEDDEEPSDDENPGEDDEEPGDDEDPGEDDVEPGDDEDPGEDDEEPGDDEDPGEDDEEPGDDEDSGENDEEPDDNEDSGEDDEEPALPDLEAPQGPVTITLSSSEDGFEFVVSGSQMLVLDGDTPVRHIELTDATSLTVDGTEMSDLIVIDLEDAAPLGLDSITVNGGGGDDQVYVDGYRSDIATTLTINGDVGNDVISAESATSAVQLNGGDGRDVLEGGSGNDVIDGGAGHDLLQGRAGNDELRGGEGNDRINGHGGNDTMSGGAGRDRLMGHGGRDVIRGEGGNDVLRGGGGNDILIGGDGRDRMLGQGGHDTMVGGAGNDVMKGGAGNDRISGNAGNDRAIGNQGQDILVTGDGDDELMGGQGQDILVAGRGNDRMAGQAARDTVVTGEGDDDVTGPMSEVDEDFEFIADWLDLV